ncbi:preprotein translocase subunit SecG [Endozoicomonas sp. 8E]|uniref:preprotein translocase subunit SecG n=1 Tax=Endozoicomonas sp. 8E TaxID=3035692 RepID=UPI002938FB49|nr:preprotein translocase subunit SecG [Endozoicomonas sp. 8E]WOG28983.1 preprotein translocase subunit SecG [Endozoicomonas sp. 8E]
METIILIVHVLASAAVVGLILLQQGKGAEAGASFGSGASQTVFGSQGTGNFMSRTTAILATVFFVTSFALAMVARQKADSIGDAGVPAVVIEESVPAGDAPIAPGVASEMSSEMGSEKSVESDAPVIESQPVESDEQNKELSLPPVQ